MATTMKHRFDGYLPVVIDVETAGVNPLKNPLLEIAAVLIDINEQSQFVRSNSFSTHVEPFAGGHIDPQALEVNKIDPHHPFRFAVPEQEALERMFEFIEAALKKHECRRAVLVGHNAHFDLSFLQMAMKRCKLTKSPLHAFTCFDTATLGGLTYGKTVLAKIMKAANIEFDKDKAHSALYDAEKTADLFCMIINNIPFSKGDR